jgi:arginine exporter protein ArgO
MQQRAGNTIHGQKKQQQSEAINCQKDKKKEGMIFRLENTWFDPHIFG